MALRSAVHSFRRAEQGAVEADFHLHMVEHCSALAGRVFHFIKVTGEASRNSSMDRGEEQAHWKGGRGKAHSAELQRVSRVGSMVQRSIHNSGQVELLFFNVTLTMSQA